MNYKQIEKITLKNHPEITEKVVQDIIADDPTILGIGDVVLKDIERIQPKAGRLDLLLQDIESNTRYEVEIQLGRTDETHIIRTIEYWDIERKRYPQYDHIGVIIAEDITSRFLNVINLFNGNIPVMAIQMTGFQLEEGFTLTFNTILEPVQLGLVDDDEEVKDITDRNYWENKGTKETVSLADNLLEYIKTFDDSYELKYNKFYIGLSKGNVPNNFAQFRPRKNAIVLNIKLAKDSEVDELLENNDFDTLEYDSKWSRYRLRLSKQEVAEKREILTDILERSYRYFNNS